MAGGTVCIFEDLHLAYLPHVFFGTEPLQFPLHMTGGMPMLAVGVRGSEEICRPRCIKMVCHNKRLFIYHVCQGQ